jgi:hypothetical protein
MSDRQISADVTDANCDRGENETVGRIQRWRNWVAAPLSKTSRWMLALGGIILPILCHLSTYDGLPANNATWQSGELHDRISFVLTPRAGFVLYPFLAFAMIALCRHLFPRSGDVRHFWIGFGITNGILVSLWYIGVFVVVLTGQDSFDPASTLVAFATFALLGLVPLVIWGFVTATKSVSKRLGLSAWKGGATLFLLYVSIASLVSWMLERDQELLVAISGSLMTPFVFGVWFAPIWSLLTYSLVGLRWFTIDRTTRQFSLLQMMGLVTYAAGLITTCRASVWLSLSAYLQLPIEQPNSCYVATAACKGHRSIVGTRPTGVPFPVNRQLQVLKAFEISLQTLFPEGHRMLRRIYDVVGPRFAKRINRPWKADIAFALLKPCEWIAAATLFVLLGRRRSVVERFYVEAGTPSR